MVSSQCEAQLESNKGSYVEFEKEKEKNGGLTTGNMLVCYPCGPGAGTPAKNIFFKNITQLLDEKIKEHDGMLLLPEHFKTINDLEPHAELRQICPVTLLLPTSEL